MLLNSLISSLNRKHNLHSSSHYRRDRDCSVFALVRFLHMGWLVGGCLSVHFQKVVIKLNPSTTPLKRPRATRVVPAKVSAKTVSGAAHQWCLVAPKESEALSSRRRTVLQQFQTSRRLRKPRRNGGFVFPKTIFPTDSATLIDNFGTVQAWSGSLPPCDRD